MRNDPDGAVVGEAAGVHDKINTFTSFLHQGPPAAVVKEAKITVSPLPEDELPWPFALRKH